MSRIDDVLQQLAHRGLLPPQSEWQGVDDFELSRLKRINGGLPEAYAAFLAAVGKSAQSQLFRGSEVFWPHPLTFRDDLRIYYDDPAQQPPIPNDATIVLLHQGYLAFWCSPSMEFDPPVYAWPNSTGGEGPEQIADSFTEWLAVFGGSF